MGSFAYCVLEIEELEIEGLEIGRLKTSQLNNILIAIPQNYRCLENMSIEWCWIQNGCMGRDKTYGIDPSKSPPYHVFAQPTQLQKR
jgi:hypothetical protein